MDLCLHFRGIRIYPPSPTQDDGQGSETWRSLCCPRTVTLRPPKRRASISSACSTGTQAGGSHTSTSLLLVTEWSTFCVSSSNKPCLLLKKWNKTNTVSSGSPALSPAMYCPPRGVIFLKPKSNCTTPYLKALHHLPLEESEQITFKFRLSVIWLLIHHPASSTST